MRRFKNLKAPPFYKHQTKDVIYLSIQFEFYIQQAKCRKLSRTSLSPHKGKVNARGIQVLLYRTHTEGSLSFLTLIAPH